MEAGKKVMLPCHPGGREGRLARPVPEGPPGNRDFTPFPVSNRITGDQATGYGIRGEPIAAGILLQSWYCERPEQPIPWWNRGSSFACSFRTPYRLSGIIRPLSSGEYRGYCRKRFPSSGFPAPSSGILWI